MNNKVIIISGPSGSGKDTLVNKMLTLGQYQKLVSDTTREKRVGEIEGKDYYFIDTDTFWIKFKRGDYFQYNDFFGTLYAYSKQELLTKIQQDSILIICHPQSIMLVTFFLKQIGIEYLTIYLDVNRDKALERMKVRGDSQESISKRVTEYAEFEWYKSKADIVINTDTSLEIVFQTVLKEILKKTKILFHHKKSKYLTIKQIEPDRLILLGDDGQEKVERDDGESLSFWEYLYLKYKIQ